MTGNRRIIKNAPYGLRFFFKDTDGSAYEGTPTGVSGEISKDGGAWAATTATPAELHAGEGDGAVTLTAAEMGADHIYWKVTNTGARSPECGMIETEPCIDSGVAQASATSYITLRSAASAVDDAYNGFLVEIVQGTGSDQKMRLILDYNGTNKRATVWPAWDTTPDTTSVYKVVEAPPGLTNLAIFYGISLRKFACAASSTTTSITSNLTGYGTNAFRNAVLIGVSSNGNQGIDRAVSAYDSTTGTFTLGTALPANPTTGDEFFLGGLIG
jgi:hypothetical protein